MIESVFNMGGKSRTRRQLSRIVPSDPKPVEPNDLDKLRAATLAVQYGVSIDVARQLPPKEASALIVGKRIAAMSNDPDYHRAIAGAGRVRTAQERGKKPRRVGRNQYNQASKEVK